MALNTTLSVSPAFAETITQVSFEVSGAQTIVKIERSKAEIPDPKVFTLLGVKPRIVIDWKNATANLAGEPQDGGQISLEGRGDVLQARYADQKNGALRMVLDLSVGASLDSHVVHDDHIRLVVIGKGINKPSLINTVSRPAPSSSVPETRVITRRSTTALRVFTNQTPHPVLKPTISTKSLSKPVIVIDPGHGGHDPGAVGNAGTHEKSITLKAAKELKKQLLATGRYSVILTRETDQYIAHNKRIRIARSHGADLFISIHADSTSSKNARGASVYTLADRAKNRSKNIVDDQNWIMDVDLSDQSDPVGDILVDLAQRRTFGESTRFADMLIGDLSGTTKLVGNSHRRAGYYVLLAPDVPAILLELGFLSNSQDEELLITAAHREKVMRSVVSAINKYF